MSPAPGVTVTLTTALPTAGAATPTGTAMFAFQGGTPVGGTPNPLVVYSADAVTAAYGTSAPITALALQVGAALANGAPQVVLTRTTSNAATPAAVTSADWTTALSALSEDYGVVAQVAIPGVTSQAAHDALAAHVGSFLSRTAFLDYDSAAATPGTGIVPGTVTAFQAAATSYGSGAGAERLTVAAPPVNMAGVGGTTWVCPASVLEMGRAAAGDARLGHTNHAPAGDQRGRGAGVIAGAVSVVDTFSASDLALLDAAGVSVIKTVNGAPTLYDWVSLSTVASYHQLSAGRFAGQIRADVSALGRQFLFEQLDAATFVAFEAGIRSLLAGYVAQRALWTGLDGTHAGYDVRVASVNNPTTIAARQLTAALAVSLTPYTAQVLLNVTTSVATTIG